MFVNHEGDHFRTRLTHTLEVAQIARTAARALALDEDLAEAVALAHDLGHSPFGHAGEEALDAALAPYGGFDHNAQTLRVITCLERRYAGFDGLNLTWETLEGVVKHNGPFGAPRAAPASPAYVRLQREHDLALASHAERRGAGGGARRRHRLHQPRPRRRPARRPVHARRPARRCRWSGRCCAAVAARHPGLDDAAPDPRDACAA